jgi:hypothetical protein
LVGVLGGAPEEEGAEEVGLEAGEAELTVTDLGAAGISGPRVARSVVLRVATMAACPAESVTAGAVPPLT